MSLITFLLALITGVIVAGVDMSHPFVKSQLLSHGIAIERKTHNSVLGKVRHLPNCSPSSILIMSTDVLRRGF